MKNIFYILMVALLFCGCKKEFDGAIEGRVFDRDTGSYIYSALVQLSDGNSLITDKYGNFYFEGLNPGYYTLKVTRSGYVEINSYNVTVESGKTVTVNLMMQKK